jgi:hypothetical protein
MFLLSGCGHSINMKEIEAPDRALVYGFIDMQDAPSNLSWVKLYQALPKTDKPYIHMGVTEGAFFLDNTKPGAYKLSDFGGVGWFGLEQRMYQYNFPTYGSNETAVRVNKSGLYFLGSYRYKKVSTSLFEKRKFDVERVNQPTEKEVLEKIMPYAKNTGWEKLIQQRMREVGR